MAEEKVQALTSRIRLASLCCCKEVDLVHRQLDSLPGVRSVKVSLIGRTAFITHTCPVDDVVSALNKAQLGASLATSGTESHELEKRNQAFVFPTLLTILWLGGVFFGYREQQRGETQIQQTHRIRLYFSVVIVIGLLPVLQKAIRSLSRHILDINCLMTIAVVGAVWLEEWFDAGLVLVLLAWARELEEHSMLKVRNQLKMSSATAAPRVAVLAEGNKQIRVEDIVMGQVICVRSGEQIPVDGVVVAGQMRVDESLLTGEAVPIIKTKDSNVLGGTLCTEGYAEIRATSVSAGSTLNTIASMVEEAGATATPTQQTLDKIIAWYVPGIVVLSAAIAIGMPMITGDPRRVWILRSLVVLISACPCALTIAGMVPSLAAISSAANHGALVKSCEKLDRIAAISVFAFDKTGTLTKAQFNVEVSPFFNGRKKEWTAEKAMHLVASVEAKSSHPLAASIVLHSIGCLTDAVDMSGLSAGLSPVTNFKSTEGLGVSGTVQVDGEAVHVEVTNRANPSPAQQSAAVQAFIKDNSTTTLLYAQINGELQFCLSLCDTVRPTAKLCVERLHSLGLSTAILTGDSEPAMKHIQAQVGIVDARPRCKPKDKLEWVLAQQREGQVCGLVGDGINDSPALKAADVGFAMGAGSSSMAVSSADVVFMQNELLILPDLINLSRHGRQIVWENVLFAVGLKGAVAVLAFFGWAALWVAVLVDCGTLLLVLANGTRPFYFKFQADATETDALLAKKPFGYGAV